MFVCRSSKLTDSFVKTLYLYQAPLGDYNQKHATQTLLDSGLINISGFVVILKIPSCLRQIFRTVYTVIVFIFAGRNVSVFIFSNFDIFAGI